MALDNVAGMVYSRHVSLRVLGLGLLFASTAAARPDCAVAQVNHAPSDEYASPDGLIVLRNGGILKGVVTKAGDYYLLTRGDDSELRLPVGDVEFTCRDLEAAYLWKRDLMKPSSAREHLLLAQWCLRHELTARAADQVLAAWAIEPEHPAIASLEQRLRQVKAPAATAVATETGEVNPPLATPRNAPSSFVSLNEIEDSLATLRPEAVEQFTMEIQSVLLNRCGNATCHGQASTSSFHLDRPIGRSTMTRRFTQRNLFAALQQVDRRFPENSPLLAASAGAHGGAAEPPLGQLDGHIARQLAEWVKKTAHGDEQLLPLTIRRAEGALLQSAGESSASTVIRAGAESIPGEEPRAAPAAFEQPADDEQTSDEDIASRDAFRPRDEFDPEIFNRQHARR